MKLNSSYNFSLLFLKIKKLCLPIDRYLIFATIIIIFFFMGLFYFRVIAYPSLDHGDSWEDAFVLISGNNFIKLGFIPCRFLPVMQPQVDKPENFYTHVPQLHVICSALIRKVFNVDSLKILKFISIIISCFILFFLFFLLRKIFDSLLALLGVFFLAVNPLFIGFADSLTRYLPMEFFRTIFVAYFINLFEKKEKSQKIILFFVWSNLFIISAISFEYIVVLCVFMFGYIFLFKKHLKRNYWLILLSAPVLAFVLHYLQNAWALGGLRNAYNDLFSSFLHRVAGRGKSELDVSLLTVRNWISLLFLRNVRIVDMYNLRSLVAFILILSVMFLKQIFSNEIYVKNSKILKLFILFFISGVSCWVILFQLCLVHGYQMSLHMLLASVFLSAAAFHLIYNFIFIKVRNALVKIILIIIVSLYVLKVGQTSILRSDLPLTPYKKDLKMISLLYRNQLNGLGSSMGTAEEVWTNYWNNLQISYYSNRNCKQVQTVEEIKNSSIKPRFFIFYFIDTGSKELFEYLKENYRIVGISLNQLVPYYGVAKYVIFENLELNRVIDTQ